MGTQKNLATCVDSGARYVHKHYPNALPLYPNGTQVSIIVKQVKQTYRPNIENIVSDKTQPKEQRAEVKKFLECADMGTSIPNLNQDEECNTPDCVIKCVYTEASEWHNIDPLGVPAYNRMKPIQVCKALATEAKMEELSQIRDNATGVDQEWKNKVMTKLVKCVEQFGAVAQGLGSCVHNKAIKLHERHPDLIPDYSTDTPVETSIQIEQNYRGILEDMRLANETLKEDQMLIQDLLLCLETYAGSIQGLVIPAKCETIDCLHQCIKDRSVEYHVLDPKKLEIDYTPVPACRVAIEMGTPQWIETLSYEIAETEFDDVKLNLKIMVSCIDQYVQKKLEVQQCIKYNSTSIHQQDITMLKDYEGLGFSTKKIFEDSMDYYWWKMKNKVDHPGAAATQVALLGNYMTCLEDWQLLMCYKWPWECGTLVCATGCIIHHSGFLHQNYNNSLGMRDYKNESMCTL
jgi:hypothetical protein